MHSFRRSAPGRCIVKKLNFGHCLNIKALGTPKSGVQPKIRVFEEIGHPRLLILDVNLYYFSHSYENRLFTFE